MIPVYACNTCGSSSAGQSLGLLPTLHKHFAGLQYQYRGFNSVHPALSETKPPEHSAESYNTLQIWGRYHVSNRVQVFAFVPYTSNLQTKDGTEVRSKGLGDVSALVNIVALRRMKNDIGQFLLAGGGIKAPTGAYTAYDPADRNGLPNMQPGTGTWDFIANANYTLQYKNSGVNAEASYTFTTAGKDYYKYGNRLSSGIMGFYRWQVNEVALLPQLGMRYEYALHDYDNYKRKWLNEQTGGYHLFGSVGMQAYYKRIGMQLGYLWPLTQHFAAGNVKATYFANAGLFLLL
jgi:hypothetical protein